MDITKPFRHYKGNLYLALHLATFDRPAGLFLREGDNLGVFTRNGSELRVTALDLCSTMPLIHTRVVYTGTERRIENEESLVIYIGLYDNPKGNRVCARPQSEWSEMVVVEDPTIGKRYIHRYSRVSS